MEEMTTGHVEFVVSFERETKFDGMKVCLCFNYKPNEIHGSTGVKHNRRLVTKNHNKNIKKHNHKTLQHRQKNETDSRSQTRTQWAGLVGTQRLGGGDYTEHEYVVYLKK